MASTAIDRIKAVADATYETPKVRSGAIAEARAAEVDGAFKSLTFPVDVTMGKAVVRISSPRRDRNQISFYAVVRVDGKVVHRDQHVIVNPPILFPDDAGDIERVMSSRDGTQKTVRFRIDPLSCAAQVVVDSL